MTLEGSRCDKCKIRRTGIKNQLEAFKVLASINPNLSSIILISNLEELISAEEAEDEQLAKSEVKAEPRNSNENHTPPPSTSNSRPAPTPRVSSKKVIRPAATKLVSPTVAPPPPLPPPPRQEPNDVEDDLVDNSITTSKLRSADEYIGQTEHNGRRMYRCLICEKILTLKNNTRLHVRRVHFKDRVSCPKCSRKFYDTNLLGIHFPKCTGIVNNLKRRTEWAAMNKKNNANNPTTTSTNDSGLPKSRTQGVIGAKVVNPALNAKKKKKQVISGSSSSSRAATQASSRTTTKRQQQQKPKDNDSLVVVKNPCENFNLKRTLRAHVQLERLNISDLTSNDEETDSSPVDGGTGNNDDDEWFPESCGRYSGFQSTSFPSEEQSDTISTEAVSAAAAGVDRDTKPLPFLRFENSESTSTSEQNPPQYETASITFKMEPRDVEQMGIKVNFDTDGGGEDADDYYYGQEEVDDYLNPEAPIGRSAEEFYSTDERTVSPDRDFMEYPLVTDDLSNPNEINDQNQDQDIEYVELDDENDDADDEPGPSFLSDDLEPSPPKLVKMNINNEIQTSVPSRATSMEVLNKIRKVITEEWGNGNGSQNRNGSATILRYECIFCDEQFQKVALAMRHVRHYHLEEAG